MAEGYNFKIVLLGEGCVGKTSCVLRYVEDKFNDKHITTLQVLFKRTAFIFFCQIRAKQVIIAKIFKWFREFTFIRIFL